MKLVLILLATFLSISGYSQHKYDWSRYSNLLFKEDSVQSFNNIEVQNHIIYPIKESKTNIEIRFYIPSNLNIQGSIFTIQYFKDTIIANEYSYFYREWSPFMIGYEFIGKCKNQMQTDICKRLTMKTVKSSFVSDLNIAVDNNLFVIPDSKKFADSIAENKIIINKPEYNCVNCSGYILCEIKVGNKYRNFRIWNKSTDYYNVNNSILFLKNNSCLLNFFKTVFK